MIVKTCVAVITAIFLSAVISSTAHADNLGVITRSSLTTTYKGIVEGQDGSLWYGSSRGKVGRVPKSGSPHTFYTVQSSQSDYVQSIARGSDNNIWFTVENKFGSITSSGQVTIHTFPSSYGHPEYITSGPDGNIWITSVKSVGNQTNNWYEYYISAYNPSGAYVKHYSVAGNVKAMATDYTTRSMWYIQGDTNANPSSVTIVRIAEDGNKISYPVPATSGMPVDIAYGNDGLIWFATNSGTSAGKIGRIDTSGQFSSPITYNYFISDLSPGLDGNMWAASYDNRNLTRIASSGASTAYSTAWQFSSGPSWLTAGTDGNMWFIEGSRVSRMGTGISSSSSDYDNDGLTATQELSLGSSDRTEDTDADGLTDFVESANFPARNALFCNSTATYCEYPSPLQRDIYVEMDWMTKPTTSGFSTDSYSMQPSTAQLNLLKTAYSNKGIKAHFDTGQLGGGNEVDFQTVIAMKQVENAPDFYNYKTGGDGLAAQFNANRYAFYHYVLLGYQYVDNDGSAYSSGGSYAGDDDTFIAYGLLRDTGNHSSFDTAIAGTILHELGHSLCLTGLNDGLPAYPDQPALCRYSGIDSSGGNSYVSSMNYSNQYSLVDYSSGVNGTVVDHDDWGAIRLFDFTNQQNLEDPYAGGPTQNKIKVKKVKTKLIKGPSIDSKKISITTR